VIDRSEKTFIKADLYIFHNIFQILVD